MKMKLFRGGKYALEGPGRLDLEVPKDSLLSINFMTGGPTQIYPTSEIALSQNGTLIRKFKVTPLKPNYPGKVHVHIVETLPMGMVTPGDVRIEVRHLDRGFENPFRVVGAMLTTPTTAEQGEASDEGADFATTK